MSAASLALIALIGWLFAAQSRRTGRDRRTPSSVGELVTTVVLVGGAALLVAQELDGGGTAPQVDLTAVAMVAVTAWFVGLQTRRAGSDGSEGTSPAVLLTTVLLGFGAILLAVPHLYSMVT
jgi:hypothetical protein